MVCKTAHWKLFQYLDGELSRGEQAAFETHLASCQDCRRLVDLERIFRETCLEPLRPDPAPDRVRENVARLLETLPSCGRAERRGGRRVRLAVLAAAGALVLVGGVVGVTLQRLWNGPTASLLRLAGASVEQHQKLVRGMLPYDVQQVPPKVAERWFSRRLDFPVRLPELTREGLSFVGGRISHVQDFDVAALHYQVEGRDVSLFIIPLDRYRKLGLGESPKFKMVTYDGYDVIVWASHGTAYSLVSEIGGQSCLICHSREENLDLPASSRAHDSL